MFVHIPPHHALSGVSHPRESFKCLFSEEKATAKRIGWVTVQHKSLSIREEPYKSSAAAS